jgi:hypothetical protein
MLSLFQYFSIVGETYCLNSLENPNDKREFKLDGCDTKFRHLHFTHTFIIIYQERRYRSLHAFESPNQCIKFCIAKHVMLTLQEMMCKFTQDFE